MYKVFTELNKQQMSNALAPVENRFLVAKCLVILRSRNLALGRNRIECLNKHLEVASLNSRRAPGHPSTEMAQDLPRMNPPCKRQILASSDFQLIRVCAFFDIRQQLELQSTHLPSKDRQNLFRTCLVLLGL